MECITKTNTRREFHCRPTVSHASHRGNKWLTVLHNRSLARNPKLRHIAGSVVYEVSRCDTGSCSIHLWPILSRLNKARYNWHRGMATEGTKITPILCVRISGHVCIVPRNFRACKISESFVSTRCLSPNVSRFLSMASSSIREALQTNDIRNPQALVWRLTELATTPKIRPITRDSPLFFERGNLNLLVFW